MAKINLKLKVDVKDAIDEINKVYDTVSKTTKVVEKISSLEGIDTNGSYQVVSKQLDTLSKKSQEISSDISAISPKLAIFGKGFEAVSGAADTANQSLKLGNSIDTLGNSLKSNTAELLNFSNAANSLAAENTLRSDLDAVAGSANNLATTLSSAFPQLKGMGSALQAVSKGADSASSLLDYRQQVSEMVGAAQEGRTAIAELWQVASATGAEESIGTRLANISSSADQLAARVQKASPHLEGLSKVFSGIADVSEFTEQSVALSNEIDAMASSAISGADALFGLSDSVDGAAARGELAAQLASIAENATNLEQQLNAASPELSGFAEVFKGVAQASAVAQEALQYGDTLELLIQGADDSAAAVQQLLHTFTDESSQLSMPERFESAADQLNKMADTAGQASPHLQGLSTTLASMAKASSLAGETGKLGNTFADIVGYAQSSSAALLDFSGSAESAAARTTLDEKLAGFATQAMTLSDQLKNTSPHLNGIASALDKVAQASGSAQQALEFSGEITELVAGADQGKAAVEDLINIFTQDDSNASTADRFRQAAEQLSGMSDAVAQTSPHLSGLANILGQVSEASDMVAQTSDLGTAFSDLTSFVTDSSAALIDFSDSAEGAAARDALEQKLGGFSSLADGLSQRLEKTSPKLKGIAEAFGFVADASAIAGEALSYGDVIQDFASGAKSAFEGIFGDDNPLDALSESLTTSGDSLKEALEPSLEGLSGLSDSIPETLSLPQLDTSELDGLHESYTRQFAKVEKSSKSSAKRAGQEMNKQLSHAIAQGDWSDALGPQQLPVGNIEQSLDGLSASSEKTGNAIEKNLTFDGVVAGVNQSLQAMQAMEDEGSASYNQLGIAIQALSAIQAVSAVLNQSAGDPYTAFGRMAAMAASVASLGFSVGSISGSFPDDAQKQQKKQGTGTVFGDSSAKSQSIQKALDITANATEELVGINRGMHNALLALSNGITGAASIISKNQDGKVYTYSNGKHEIKETNVFDRLGAKNDQLRNFVSSSGNTSALALAASPLLLSSVVTSKIASLGLKALGGKSKVTDRGIEIGGGKFKELDAAGNIRAYEVTRSKKWAWSKSKKRTGYADITEESRNQFSEIFDSMELAVSKAASALGFEDGKIKESIDNFKVETQKISLKGLSAEEQEKEISAVFSSIFDNLAGSVVDFAPEFAKAGEGTAETLIRVATQVQTVESAMERMGFQAKRASSADFAKISDDLIEAAGGMDKFVSGMTSFIDNFATDEHKFDLLESDLSKALDGVGIDAIPATREAMWELMQTLNASEESGKKQIAALLASSELAEKYYQTIDEQERARLETASQYKQFADSLMTPDQRFSSLKSELEDELGILPKRREGFAELLNQLELENDADSDRIQTMIELRDKVEEYYNTLEERERERLEQAQQSTDKALSALRTVIDRQIKYVEDQLQLDKEALEAQKKNAIESAKLRVDSAKEQVSSLKETVKQIGSAYDSLRDKVQPLRDYDRQQAVSKLQLAASNGVLTDVGEYASKATDIESSQFVDGVSFEREQRKTLALLERLDADGNAQLTTAEKQLRTAETQIETIEASFNKQISTIELAAESQINNLESIYIKQEEELDILRGSNEHLGSIKTQLANLHNAMKVEKAIQRDVNNMSKNEQDVRQLYWKILGREADQGGLNTWLGQLNAGKTLKDVEWAIIHSQEFANQRNDKYSDVHGRAAVTGEVRRLYQEILGRIDEGPAGVGFFIDEVLTGRRSLTRVERDLRWIAMDGSHAKGLNRVPFDGYRAELHRDEMVLTADVANTVRRNVQSNTQQSSDALTRSVEAIRNELALVQSYLRSISISTSVTANTMDDWDAVGMPAERQIDVLEGAA
ncbi:hypothetical protein CHH28_03855 [Bacterioplanes sanyensis]|uniref:DUF4214 domain-containing protein n=1 Tax=Bacterioplanes sanyensis TaxID=1249553 RepID=A0A222FGJ0_9GAMM|nr:DUF4214 domain-containing protein [Bacterioplanes sanyensis]ASP37860.1 hypothetical protein CHH28_03855 [Bacterioplanes sanyensis]